MGIDLKDFAPRTWRRRWVCCAVLLLALPSAVAVLAQPANSILPLPGSDSKVEITTVADEEKGDQGTDLEKSEKAKVVLSPGPATPLPEGDAQLGQLLRLWGVFGTEVNRDCTHLQIGQLRCFSGHTTLRGLARFNRPAILFLNHDDVQQQVLITHLDDKTAVLIGAEGTRKISRQRLEKLWQGKFYMIWRASSKAAFIHDGMGGAPVQWLLQRLPPSESEDEGQTEDQPSAAAVFDADLAERVRNFQRIHGLMPDGIAGPRTQITLNSLAPEPGIPTLDQKADSEN